MGLFGGPDTVVFLHRVFAVVLIGIAIFHGISVWIRRGKQGQPLRKRIYGPDSLMPRLVDFRQFGSMLRWSVGRGSRPALDRWSYREKFDYWALAVTATALACTGLILWFPTFFARFVSGYWFNVAMVIHSNAGLLAMGFALMIHILNSSLRRAEFPVNDVMFTGRLPEKEFQEERFAEYERLAKEGALDRIRVRPVSDRNRKIAFYGTLASQALAQIRVVRSVEPLIAALKDKERDVRLAAVQALGQIQDPRSVEPLITALQDGDPDIRIMAIQSLGQIQDPRAVEPLIDAIQHKPEIVRTEAIWVLKQLTDEDFGTDYNLWRRWWLAESPAGSGASKP
jgi:hypothetical protein